MHLYYAQFIVPFVKLLETYQTPDEFLQFFLGLPHSFFCANHSDEFLVFIICSGKDYPGPSAVPNLAYVSTTFSNEKLVVFWLCMQLCSVTLCLLKNIKQEGSLKYEFPSLLVVDANIDLILSKLIKMQLHTTVSPSYLHVKINASSSVSLLVCFAKRIFIIQ